MVKKLILPAAIVYTIWLTIVSLINLSNVPSLGSSFDDKIYHFIAYVGLGFLWVTYFKYNIKSANILLTFGAVLLYGIILELVQHKINPNRTFDLYDLLANCIGVIVGTLIAAKLNVFKLK